MIDHGILNTPLSKRGNTLFGETRAQFDKRVAAEHKAIAKARHERVKAAREAIAVLTDEQVAALIPRLRVKTIIQAKKALRSHASWQPDNLLRVLGKEMEA